MIPSRATLPPLSPLPVSRAQSPANVPRNTGGQERVSSPPPRAQSRSLWCFSTNPTKRAPCKVPRLTIHSKHAVRVVWCGLRVVWCSAPSPHSDAGHEDITPPTHTLTRTHLLSSTARVVTLPSERDVHESRNCGALIEEVARTVRRTSNQRQIGKIFQLCSTNGSCHRWCRTTPRKSASKGALLSTVERGSALDTGRGY